MNTITPIPVAELKPNYYLFGNKGAVWSNTAHISKSGENGTLCGLPMLSSNWARIEEVKEIGCPTCIARYHEEMKTIKATLELIELLNACDGDDNQSPSNVNTEDEQKTFAHIADSVMEAERLGAQELRKYYGEPHLAFKTTIEGRRVIIKPVDTDKPYYTSYLVRSLTERELLGHQLYLLREKYKNSIGDEANRLYNRILALKDQLAHL